MKERNRKICLRERKETRMKEKERGADTKT